MIHQKRKPQLSAVAMSVFGFLLLGSRGPVTINSVVWKKAGTHQNLLLLSVGVRQTGIQSICLTVYVVRKCSLNIMGAFWNSNAKQDNGVSKSFFVAELFDGLLGMKTAVQPSRYKHWHPCHPLLRSKQSFIRGGVGNLTFFLQSSR